jgi:hypothetical protein
MVLYGTIPVEVYTDVKEPVGNLLMECCGTINYGCTDAVAPSIWTTATPFFIAVQAADFNPKCTLASTR